MTKHPKMSIAEARAVERVATEIEHLLLYLRDQGLDTTQIRAVGNYVNCIISALVSCAETEIDDETGEDSDDVDYLGG